jgi:clan AA aspartic protease
MITGAVNSDLEALLRLTLRDSDGNESQVDAVIDTGFNGYLTLPSQLVDQLGLPYLYRQEGELADGSLHVFDVHAVTVLWGGKERQVEVAVADTDPLLGMALLAKHSLSIKVVSGGKVSVAKIK